MIFTLINRGLLDRERERMRGNQVRLEDKRDITENNLNKESGEERDGRSVANRLPSVIIWERERDGFKILNRKELGIELYGLICEDSETTK